MKLFLTLLFCLDPAIADDQLLTHIDVHFNFDPQEEIDLYWKKTLQRTWIESKKHERLKAKVFVHTHSEPDYPALAYCVLPRGFKVSQYSEWVKLDRETIPSQFFYPRFLDYLWTEWTIEWQRQIYLEEMTARDTERHADEERRVEFLAVQWARRHPKIVDFRFYASYISEVRFNEYDPVTCRSVVLSVPLSEIGFVPLPAIAWDRPPRVPENPLNYGVLRK